MKKGAHRAPLYVLSHEPAQDLASSCAFTLYLPYAGHFSLGLQDPNTPATKAIINIQVSFFMLYFLFLPDFYANKQILPN
jgi:hypothetical protein